MRKRINQGTIDGARAALPRHISSSKDEIKGGIINCKYANVTKPDRLDWIQNKPALNELLSIIHRKITSINETH